MLQAAPMRTAIDDGAGGTDALQLFLNEISRFRLLTPREEVDLSKRIENG